jgi:uncharacterized protein YuzE
MNLPRLTYDPDANAMYLYLTTNKVAATIDLNGSTFLDVDSDGMPVGLEVLGADDSALEGIAPPPDGTLLLDVLRRNEPQTFETKG